MSYVSTANGQPYSDAKFAPENLNFVIIANLIDTSAGGERLIKRKHFPYKFGGEAQAFADAKKFVAKHLMPKMTADSEISLSRGARPADQHWPVD